ncbi:MAG: Rne/Rng family ribonuclease [Acidobacteria bacterium]|nr:Rne/Rng family ribonuclease [Acidobacteriota bacterium]
MTKELVVASNRHETRVAILEDDQLVEVFHQRSQEYSLAGSIHKGRVTRVLPGMQSAFVDIGLERDAFLYVSDFFEDNEEYDQVALPAEESGARATPPPAPPAEAPPVVEAAAAAAGGDAAAPAERGQPRDDRDRRGRRSRRRRGRSRGFPDSKYASPAGDNGSTPVAEWKPEAAPVIEDLPMVLPGESLAKYRHGEDEEPGRAEIESELDADLPPEETAPSAAVVEPAVETPVAEAPASEPEPEPVTVSTEAPVIEELPTAPPDTADEDEPSAEEDFEAEGAEAEVGAEASSEEETPEPARIPTSLTATLREQGLRYPHRMSRRMRRKMRTSGPEEQSGTEGGRPERPERPEPPPRAEQQQRAVAKSDRPAQPSISDLLREGQEIIVQIAKEPLGQKGARITSYVALPGRFVVYMPTVDHAGVSRKIGSDEERQRLKRILQSNRQGMPGGFIMRTAGEGRSEEELRADMQALHNLWLDLRQKAEKRKAPALIHHDLDLVERILRDQLNSSFKAIWVDNEEVYENVLSFLQRFQPSLVNRVKLYTRDQPIFDSFNITTELDKALRPKVWLKSGGYIVINQTEALVAIDINTGKFVGKSNRLEDTIVKTNTDAVKEIVRQIRLRDLGGIIVVDFIDMDERKNRQKVMQALEEAMRLDKAPNKILSFNDFGLVAITRKRVKQSLERTLCSPCPYCEGAGYVKSVSTVIGEILVEAHKIRAALEKGDVMLRVNPEVAKVLKSHNNDHLQELEEILGRPVIVKSDPQLHQEKFDLA